ncbi:MAG: hypothetical protein OEX12_01265 [Gammaproteobacteria bacterium]|nr:hypothetical protein [Gammaproteobacteria bacterium]
MNKISISVDGESLNYQDIDALIAAYGPNLTQQQDWLNNLTKASQLWSAVGSWAESNTQKIVNAVATVWSELPAQVTSTYEGDLVQWAQTATQRSLSHVNNMLNVWETYYTAQYDYDRPPNFDPDKVTPTKLLAASGAAKRGLLTEELWEDLIDPSITVAALKEELPSIRNRKGKEGELRYWVENGYVWADSAGELFIVAEISQAENSNQRRAIDRFITQAGLKNGTS